MKEPMMTERFTLELTSLPDEAPVMVRLRLVLKRLLRSYGFRCTRVTKLPAEPPRR